MPETGKRGRPQNVKRASTTPEPVIMGTLAVGEKPVAQGDFIDEVVRHETTGMGTNDMFFRSVFAA
jgi:hypothetical protein